MDACEQQLVVRVDARPFRPLVECARLRAWEQAGKPRAWSIHEGSATPTAESLGTSSHYQLPARAGMRVNANRTPSTAPIQYP